MDVVDAGAADDGAAARRSAIRAKVKKTEAEVADGRITPAVAAEQIAEMLQVSEKLRILITGFGPFPGAPYNPTQPLVARLTAAAPSGVRRRRTVGPHLSGDLQRGRPRIAASCWRSIGRTRC